MLQSVGRRMFRAEEWRCSLLHPGLDRVWLSTQLSRVLLRSGSFGATFGDLSRLLSWGSVLGTSSPIRLPLREWTREEAGLSR